MKDKEKQIESMSKDKQWQRRDNYCLRIQKALQYKGTGDNEDVPSILVDFEDEIRKEMLSKDSIVISKEEYRCLKSIEKSYDPFWFCAFGGCEGACKECKDTCEMSIFVKERKEMTEKILTKIKQFLSNVETVVYDDKYSLYPEIGYKCSKVDDFIDELTNNSVLR